MQERFEWKESMGKVRMARGGPRGSLASVHRSLPRSDAQQPSLQASTGSLQGSYRKLRGSTGSLCNSTGCSIVGVLGDGEVMEWCGRIGEMEMEQVMAQEQRSQMEKECMQWVDGWKDGINERLSKWSYVSNGRAGR